MTDQDKLLWCMEEYIHVSNMDQENEKRTGLGGGEPYQTFTSSVGELYRACLREHGRCISKVYVGEDKPQQVGWVFLKKNPPEPEGDGEGLIQTWVSVFKNPGVKHVVIEGREYATFPRSHR